MPRPAITTATTPERASATPVGDDQSANPSADLGWVSKRKGENFRYRQPTCRLLEVGHSHPLFKSLLGVIDQKIARSKSEKALQNHHLHKAKLSSGYISWAVVVQSDQENGACDQCIKRKIDCIVEVDNSKDGSLRVKSRCISCMSRIYKCDITHPRQSAGRPSATVMDGDADLSAWPETDLISPFVDDDLPVSPQLPLSTACSIRGLLIRMTNFLVDGDLMTAAIGCHLEKATRAITIIQLLVTQTSANPVTRKYLDASVSEEKATQVLGHVFIFAAEMARILPRGGDEAVFDKWAYFLSILESRLLIMAQDIRNPNLRSAVTNGEGLQHWWDSGRVQGEYA